LEVKPELKQEPAATPLMTAVLRPRRQVEASDSTSVPEAGDSIYRVNYLCSPLVTFCSPWTPGVDTAGLVIAAAKVLAREGVVAVIDADFKKADLAAKMGVTAAEVWKYDWRREPVALCVEKNLHVFLLDSQTRMTGDNGKKGGRGQGGNTTADSHAAG
jgi:hypothetical protein